MKYQYRAFDKMGRQVGGVIDASTTAEASENLRRQGLFVTEVTDATFAGSSATATPAAGAARTSATGGGTRSVGTGQRLKFQATFTRQLHGMVAGGTPLVQSLMTIERQIEVP